MGGMGVAGYSILRRISLLPVVGFPGEQEES